MSSSPLTPRESAILAHVDLVFDITMGICFGIALVIIVYRLRTHPHAAKIHSAIKWLVVLYISLYFLAFVFVVVMNIDDYSEHINDDWEYLNSTQFTVLYIVDNTLWSLGRLSFFALWVCRHYLSFKDSAYRSHIATYVLLLAGICSIFVVLAFVNVVIFALGKIENDRVLLVLVCIYALLQIAVSIGIMVLFITKLFALMLDITKYDEIIYSRRLTKLQSVTPVMSDQSDDANESVSELSYPQQLKQKSFVTRATSSSTTVLLRRWQSFMIENDNPTSAGNSLNFRLTPRQVILINTMVQQTALSSMALVSTQIYMVIFMVNMLQSTPTFTTELVLQCYQPLDRLMQLICVCLSLNFSHSLYRLTCQTTHNQFRKICEAIAKKRIERNVIQQEEELIVQSDYQLM